MNEKYTLIYIIFKAKYFSNGSFLDSRLGHNPSYVWRDIWEAKEDLILGCRWRASNGHTIKIWTDHWIFGIRSLQHCLREGDARDIIDTTDYCLIDAHTKWRDVKNVRTPLPPTATNEVLKIILNPEETLLYEHHSIMACLVFEVLIDFSEIGS